jgi:hypothetical protein
MRARWMRRRLFPARKIEQSADMAFLPGIA